MNISKSMANGILMAVNDVKITRLELIRTKSRIKVASKGLSLLKMKRSRLILEFFELARQIQLMNQNVVEYVSKAIDTSKIAEAQAGRLNFERIAARKRNEQISVNVSNVMGVKIPNLNMKSNENKSLKYELISVSASIEDVRKNYTVLLTLLIEIAEKQNSLKRLLHEIEKLNRRSNAIENIVVPKMQQRAKYIKQRLEDIERDQIISLKVIKRKIGNANGQAN
ncbi:MAG: V-type ATP synthase subunit D [Candidatus Marsarchaeota archaeon]|nr:V-type ATP synthase subunit D [Candidatus Marsarchaeota archaeon]